MAKKPHFKPTVRTREMMPLARKTKEGVLLACPFCTPTHPLTPGTPSPCGTRLVVTAVQEILSARTVRLEKFTCVKCGETGKGEMVRYFDGFLHIPDCDPETEMLTQPPKYSKMAKFVDRLPESVKKLVVKRTGVIKRVREINTEGEETGVILGYYFEKIRKAAQNG